MLSEGWMYLCGGEGKREQLSSIVESQQIMLKTEKARSNKISKLFENMEINTKIAHSNCL